MIEYEHNIRRQVAEDRAKHVAEEYRRAQPVRASRRREAVVDRIAAVAAIARRRRAAHDPAYRH